MPSKKVKAIVTRAVAYNESDMIVTLVSVEEGKLTATVRGCLKPNAKLRYAASPMNFGEYVLADTHGRYIVTECSQIESFSEITTDLQKYYSATLILELLQKLSENSEPSLFVSALTELNALADNEKSGADATTAFLISALDKGGSHFDFSHCAVCKCCLSGECAFDSADGIVCCDCASFNAIKIDAISRQYLSGENKNITERLKTKSNMLLADLVYTMLGIKISNHYFTEQL
ncbi:MAG: DNA repair protein RecO [Clostridia bacterium]